LKTVWSVRFFETETPSGRSIVIEVAEIAVILPRSNVTVRVAPSSPRTSRSPWIAPFSTPGPPVRGPALAAAGGFGPTDGSAGWLSA
jgi:hypothetical protein